MLAATSNAEVLRTKIKEDLDILDVDELQKLYQALAAMAAEKAVKFADKDWAERFISREKITAEVEKFRKSSFQCFKRNSFSKSGNYFPRRIY